MIWAREGGGLRYELVRLGLCIRSAQQQSTVAPQAALPLRPRTTFSVTRKSQAAGLGCASSSVRNLRWATKDFLHGVVDLDCRAPEMSGPARHPLMVERKERS